MRGIFASALLVAGATHGQGFGGVFAGSAGGSGGVCTLNGTTQGVGTSFRATATSGTAFQSDNVLECALDTGPGARNCVGTNVAGDILLGPGSGSGTFVRAFGTIIGLNIQGQDIASSNVMSYASALDQGTNAFMRNTNSGKSVLVTDPEGLQINATTPIRGVVRTSVTYDFPSIPNGDCVVQSLTVTGAAVGDYVSVNADFMLPTDVGIGNARVTATNTVDVRLCNHDASVAADPASGAYLIRLER